MSTQEHPGLPKANTEGRDAFLAQMPARPESDPNLVFVGVSVGRGGVEPETEAALQHLARGEHDLPWRFFVRRCSTASTAMSRNILTSIAWSTPASKQLTIDADIKFGLPHVRRVMSSPHRCVSGIYPKKVLGEEAQWCVSYAGGDEERDDGQGRQSAVEVGAGFLRLDMSLVEDLVRADPSIVYLSDEPGPDGQPGGAPRVNVWGEGVVVADWTGSGVRWPRYRTEDFAICDRVRALGEVVWADTLCQLGHIGRVDFLEVARLIQHVRAKVAD